MCQTVLGRLAQRNYRADALQRPCQATFAVTTAGPAKRGCKQQEPRCTVGKKAAHRCSGSGGLERARRASARRTMPAASAGAQARSVPSVWGAPRSCASFAAPTSRCACACKVRGSLRCCTAACSRAGEGQTDLLLHLTSGETGCGKCSHLVQVQDHLQTERR